MAGYPPAVIIRHWPYILALPGRSLVCRRSVFSPLFLLVLAASSFVRLLTVVHRIADTSSPLVSRVVASTLQVVDFRASVSCSVRLARVIRLFR